MKHFIILLLLVILPVAAFSQVNSDGKDFWIGYVPPSYTKVAAPPTSGFQSASLLISSYTDNIVSIYFFDRLTGLEQNVYPYYTVSARTAIQVSLPSYMVKPNDTGDVAEYIAVHVVSKKPIKVEFFSTGACGGGSYLAASTATLGRKYVIASYGNNPANLAGPTGGTYAPAAQEISHGFFEVTAPYDSTIVTITSNSTTMGGHPGYQSGANHTAPKIIPYNVMLMRGQCYVVRSASADSTDDISGSIVESSKPVAVIAGHENAALGGLSNRSLEGRDYMVEQMYPATVWDSTGYVMTPLKDSQPADATLFDGIGENYRTFSDKTACINLTLGSVSGPTPMSTSKLAQPPPERFGVTEPVNFESCNGAKFSVMMYDLRNFASSAPYPAPSMITVIPISRWKTSYLWYVPSNKFEILQGYYVDVIAETTDLNATTNGLVASFNGGQIKPIKQSLNLETQWKGSIPNHPDLTGARFKVNPGCYYVHAPHPFMVYNYGFRGLDPDFNLGDFDAEDFFFSYGCPTGFSVPADTSNFHVKVDTGCGSWNVCVTDGSVNGVPRHITEVDLIDDATNDVYNLGPITYKNCSFDNSLDPNHINSLLFSTTDTSVCFKVFVSKANDTAFAPLYIVDDQGSATVVYLHYKTQMFKLTPDSGRYLSVNFENHTDSCKSYVLKNTAIFDSLNKKANPLQVNSAVLTQKNPHYSLSSLPTLPATLYAGDSVVFTACFTPTDTTTQLDTILISAGCNNLPIDLAGNAAIPVIYASDHDFGAVFVDSTKCDTVGVTNIGSVPFTLTKNWVLDNFDPAFSFSAFGTNFPKTFGSNDLPITLTPKQKVLLSFCYSPTAEQSDTTTQFWGTSLEAPYQHSNKDFSKLSGRGVRSGFVWDRKQQVFYLDQNLQVTSDTQRVWLVNISNLSTPVDSVFLSGPDASDFKMIKNKLGFNPLTTFNIPASDSIWVDVAFIPDLTKVPKFADRHATLTAASSGETSQTIDLVGTWQKSGISQAPPPPHFAIYPNPVSGSSIIVSFDKLTSGTLAVYDVLGRELFHQPIPSSIPNMIVPVINMTPGMYYVKVVTTDGNELQKFEVRR
jgi:hypothetical protein